MISAVQYRKLMKVYRETDNLSESARKAGIDRKTARKCIHGGPPQGRRGPRTWRTREDPFEGVWKEIEGLLKQWRQQHGETPELYFPQEHRPGKQLQLDWFGGKSLGITIAGEPFVHLLCHTVLPFSNWEWVIPARSESFLSLKRTLQASDSVR